jgi:transketolase
VLAQRKPTRMRILGLPKEQLYNGSSAEVFAHYGLTAEGIAQSCMEVIA